MLIEILAIVEDGTKRNPALPLSSQTPVRMPIASTATLRLSVVGANAVPAYVEDGDVYELHLAKQPAALVIPPFVGVPNKSFGPNVVDFTISSNSTRALPYGAYVYDVWRVRGGNREQIVGLSAFQLLPISSYPRG